MINHSKVLTTKEEVVQFVVENHEFNNQENQYKLGLNGVVVRSRTINEMIDIITKNYLKG